MEELVSSSSDDETTDGEGNGGRRTDKVGKVSSGVEMMSLYSDVSSDDFKRRIGVFGERVGHFKRKFSCTLTWLESPMFDKDHLSQTLEEDKSSACCLK